MSSKILVTGGAGYIGGSVIAELISGTYDDIRTANVTTAVRTTEQAQAISKLGVQAFQLDLSDEVSVTETILRNKIDIVVHTASSAVPAHAHNLITALGQRRKHSGREVYYIHSGIAAMFTEEGGWFPGPVKDSDNIYEQEKSIGSGNPVRGVDLLVVDESKAHGVTSFNVVVPGVYGKGNGEWKKVSVSIPAFVRASIKDKVVHKFEKDAYAAQVHVSDLSKIYALLVSKIFKRESVPSGEKGYYFAFAHRASWWAVMEGLASSLHERGLVSNSEPQVWPSYEVAAETLGWPVQHVRPMGTSGGQQHAVNAYQHLGWQPQWDEKRFLENMGEEVENVLKFDDHAPTLFKPLMKA